MSQKLGKILRFAGLKVLDKFDFCVDILKAESGGYYLTEINGIPGWRGLQSTTSVNIAERIVEHVMELVRR